MLIYVLPFGVKRVPFQKSVTYWFQPFFETGYRKSTLHSQNKTYISYYRKFNCLIITFLSCILYG